MHFFSSLQNIESLVALVVIALLAWFSLDMRSILKEGQRRNQLSIEGRWKDLEQHFEQISKPHRPFVWFYRKFLMPGSNVALYALFLHQQGRPDEALAKMDQAIRQNEGKLRIFRNIFRSQSFRMLCSSLSARILILTDLGRYDQARETAARLQQLTGPNGRVNAGLA
ncbi:MAG TPA: hypothetical protein VH255_00375, partial [Verrucomicrobiae bacterium]|nr:hypothetical protein [Verrucomicrobiae bacterium]